MYFIVSAPQCEPVESAGNPDPSCSFQVAWSINPHMRVGAADATEAQLEHRRFVATLAESGARLERVPFVRGAFDSVFAKDNAVLMKDERGRRALIARPLMDERAVEQPARARALEALGFEIVGAVPEFFEGGDLVVPVGRGPAWMGHGFRTEPDAAFAVEAFLDREVIPLELRQAEFYHLDTAMAMLGDHTVFACRDAFTAAAWRELVACPEIDRLIPVPREEAMCFGLNWVECGDKVILGTTEQEVPVIAAALREAGKEAVFTPLRQFRFAGGSAACLVSPVHGAAETTLVSRWGEPRSGLMATVGELQWNG